LGDPGGEA